MTTAISPAEFYAAVPRDHWVLSFEGALTHYPCPDAAARAEFAVRVAQLPNSELCPDLELRREGITVRLASSWDAGGLPSEAATLAPQISEVARDLGLSPTLDHLQTVQIAVDGGQHAVAFWQAVTAYNQVADADIIDPLRRLPGVWNQAVEEEREAPARFHVDISVTAAESARRIEAAIAAGGRVVADHAPYWTTLADPDGNLVDLATWPDLT